MTAKAVGAGLLAVGVLWAGLGTFRFVVLIVALVALAAGFFAAKWAFVPRSELPRNRVRHQRIRLYLRLHPGRGHATWWELHRQWSRTAAYKRVRQVRA